MGSSNTSFNLTISLQNSIIVKKKGGFMEAQYFNTYEISKAVDVQYSNPLEAKVMFENYFSKFPDDYASYPLYISHLISLGEIEKALKLFNYVERKVNTNSNYKFRGSKYHFYEYGMFNCKLKLLFQTEKYEELLYYCRNNMDKFSNIDLESICFYCMGKLRKLDRSKRGESSYLHRQIIEYQECDFRYHIEKHILTPSLDNENSNVFVEGFPIDTVINEIKKYIPSEKRILSGTIMDFYTFKYDNCGKDNYKNADYIKVVCFHNTGDIITMCPVANGENMPYIDLSYLRKEDEPKVKVLSQIDKFKMRYNKK